jgi:hypothetical protein
MSERPKYWSFIGSHRPDDGQGQHAWIHPTIVDRVHDRVTAERSEWLDRVFGAAFRGSSESLENPVDAAEYAHMLQDWQVDLPQEHSAILESISATVSIDRNTGKTLAQMAGDAFKNGDWRSFVALQTLCLSIHKNS